MAGRGWERIDSATTPGGSELTLHQRGRDFLILVDGKGLMSSEMHGSEEALATFGLARAAAMEAPVVLVGGLGLGFTLRATLDALPPGARVVVAELLEAVVRWNRGPIGPLAGRPLDDPRVEVVVGDVSETLARRPGTFDALLLDVDNGPRAFTQGDNEGLYGDAGIALCKAALTDGGVLAVWSAWEDRKFLHRLSFAGFESESRNVRARLDKGGPNHTIFLGALPAESGALRKSARAGEREDGRGRRKS